MTKARFYTKALSTGGSAAVALFALTALAVAAPELCKAVGLAVTSAEAGVVLNAILNGADLVMLAIAMFGIFAGGAGITWIGIRAIVKIIVEKEGRTAAIKGIIS